MIEKNIFEIKKKEQFGLFLIGVLIFLPIVTFLIFIWWSMKSPLNIGEAKKVRISKGERFVNIGKILFSSGIVRSATLFNLYVLSRGWAGNLQPGEYIFSGSLSIPEVARKILSGPEDVEITIPEGLSYYEIEDILVRAEIVKPGEFSELVHSPDSFSNEFPFLSQIQVKTLEGFLFPDTYRIDPRKGARHVLEKMLKAFQDKVFVKLEPKFKESLYSISDIVTIASMIEREAKTPQDRRLISGILWKRLENGIPLQVDATVVYAWKLVNPQWSLGLKSRLSLSDLKIDSPYNTYTRAGLPPAPISNPGFDSIQAALEPLESEYLYYLSTPDGKIYYSKTFEEHKKLKEKLYYP
jgi:UPF0755 protein